MSLDYYVWYQNATLLHKNLLKPLRNGDGSSASKVHYENAKLNYLRVAREISGQLSESLVKFDYGLIAVGLALTTAVCIKYLILMLYIFNYDLPFISDLLAHSIERFVFGYCNGATAFEWSETGTVVALTSYWNNT